MILYGDVGGTKTQFLTEQQLQDSSSTGQSLQIHHFENCHYSNFPALLQHFLRNVSGVEKLYLSVAGPVLKNQCQLTNLDWHISAEELCDSFGFKQVQLLNDLTATAYAAAKLGPDDYISLQGGLPRLEEGPIAVMSVGTGLGESVVVWLEELQQYRSIGGEGGHRNFAPRSAIEQSLSEYQQAVDRTSFFDTELLVSGEGLSRIYQFFLQLNSPNSISPDTGEQLLAAAEIAARAATQSDDNAVKALELFIDLIASEAANVALQYYSDSGVIIAGGIPLKIARQIDHERFLQRFRQHATFSDWLGRVPLAFCTNYHAPILGLQYYQEIHSQGTSA